MIVLKNGDILRFTVSFYHQGKAFTGAKAYASIGKRDTWFNEVSGMNGVITVTGIVDDKEPTLYKVIVDVPISNIGGAFGAEPGPGYEAYVKLINIPGPDLYWYGPLNDISFEAPLEEAEFSNLSATYAKK